MFEGLVKSVRNLKNIFAIEKYTGVFISEEAAVKHISNALDEIDDQCLDLNVALTLLKIDSANDAVSMVATKGGKFGSSITVGNSFRNLAKLKEDKKNLAQGVLENGLATNYYLNYVMQTTKSVRNELQTNINKEHSRINEIFLNSFVDLQTGNER
ncbi:MAG TPA: hypothetical protein PLZ05_01505 [Alphaproteobacteria bacterium]|nr:hypothetical protein [Alphaproteobacteria bacterium]